MLPATPEVGGDQDALRSAPRLLQGYGLWEYEFRLAAQCCGTAYACYLWALIAKSSLTHSLPVPTDRARVMGLITLPSSSPLMSAICPTLKQCCDRAPQQVFSNGCHAFLPLPAPSCYVPLCGTWALSLLRPLHVTAGFWGLQLLHLLPSPLRLCPTLPVSLLSQHSLLHFLQCWATACNEKLIFVQADFELTLQCK